MIEHSSIFAKQKVVNSAHLSIEPLRYNKRHLSKCTYGGIAEFKLAHYRLMPLSLIPRNLFRELVVWREPLLAPIIHWRKMDGGIENMHQRIWCWKG